MGVILNHYTEIKLKIENEIEKIQNLLNENPLSNIIEGRIKAQKISEEHKGDYKTISKLIEPLAKEEKRLFKVAEEQQKTNDYIEKLVALNSELYEVNNEIYKINQKNKRRDL